MTRRDLIAVFSATAAWPITAGAQQPMPVIGYLSAGSAESDNIPGRLIAFRRGLEEMGYVERWNVDIEYRWAEFRYDRLPGLAADLVRREVAVIATSGGSPPAIAAKAATSTIPIVFTLGIDPVQSGLVVSLNRPGGNVTGVVLLTAELSSKRLDLLHALLPTTGVVALLVNPTNRFNDPEARSAEDAARALGLQLHLLRAATPSEIDSAFATLAGLHAGALLVSADPFFTAQRSQIVALAAGDAVPAIYFWREFVADGGLMSYGPDLADSFRLEGVYVGKILKGAKPADLPVQQVAKLELVINLKTAKALGVTIPLTLIARADEVIE
jgi:putative ABC transport system substrate-binding protein